MVYSLMNRKSNEHPFHLVTSLLHLPFQSSLVSNFLSYVKRILLYQTAWLITTFSKFFSREKKIFNQFTNLVLLRRKSEAISIINTKKIKPRKKLFMQTDKIYKKMRNVFLQWPPILRKKKNILIHMQSRKASQCSYYSYFH